MRGASRAAASTGAPQGRTVRSAAGALPRQQAWAMKGGFRMTSRCRWEGVRSAVRTDHCGEADSGRGWVEREESRVWGREVPASGEDMGDRGFACGRCSAVSFWFSYSRWHDAMHRTATPLACVLRAVRVGFNLFT